MATILEHIQALDRNTLTRLYHQPATCLAMLRLLQPLAKHVVMRLLFVSAVEMVVVSAWIYAERQTALEEALASLFKFNIASSENGVLKINAVYQANLKNALVGGGNTSSFGLPTDSKDKKDITTDYLDTYARESWEAVLHFLVGTPTDKKPSAVVALMEGSGLMARNAMRSSDELRITNKGFQFLLQDVNEQVWGFLLQYLEMAEPKLGMDPVDVLNFLFQLGSLEFGQDYSVDVLTDTQKQMLGSWGKITPWKTDDLKHFGLVYQRKKKSSRFYPTRLATSLTSGASASGDTGDAGYIIVETNFKVYAYTTSPLQIAVLSLFLSLKARFSNMVIGVLTRDSVRQAYDNGISADQICQFLTNHAHPEMKKQLPPTVVDQIRLWESERKRAVAMPAHLYLDFPRNVDYLEAVGFARSLGYVLWSSDEKRMFAVSIEGHNRMREYLASKKR